MDKRPIGVFDSGLGGLTALRELAHLLPGEDLVYFGDTGRVPYGNRSRETIIKYARQDVAFLNTFDLKAMVIACGTVSTTAIELLAAENTVPVFGVVEPAAQAAAQGSGNGKIGLIATEASIRSGAYERALAKVRPEAEIWARACPLFVPLVENGYFKPGNRVTELVAAEYLGKLKQAGVDTLMLGCTHYPLLREIIGDFMGPDVKLIDVGAQCARQVEELLRSGARLNGRAQGGKRRYFVSDTVGEFERLASLFLGEDVTGEVEQVDITAF